MVKSVANFVAWKHINEKCLEFGGDGCTVRLGLALDGVNPFNNLSLCHSTWPVVLLNYNLQPWLMTKRYFFNINFDHTQKGVLHINKCGCVFTTTN
jgi:hypothetical protein